MSKDINGSLGESLRQAVPPITDSELERDLWPLMLRRLQESPRPVPWFDWALLVLVAIWALSAPQMIPILFFHL